MTTTAIYARYSSDKQRESSIDDQVRNCKAYAKREGWSVGTIYADRAQSGSKANRPEYKKMLADADEKAFDVLLMEDLSRLSRNNVEQGRALELLIFEGIRVIGISDGYDSASESHEIVSGVRGITNSIYLKDLKAKTHRGLMGKALNGQNTGGRAYGYQHVPIEHPTDRDAYGRPKIVGVKRKVDAEQAEVVRRVFKEFAAGRGYREVAARLNADGIKPLRRETWGGSTIRPMLRNQVYIGKVIWNRREWKRSPKTGKRVSSTRDNAEWVRHDAPELRIVSDDLWEQVEKRRETLGSTHKGRVADGKKRPGKTPSHLFTGLLKCDACGGKFIVANRSHFMCANRANRRMDDKAHCNTPAVRKDVLDQKLLHAIKTELFDERSFAAFKTEIRRVLAERLKNRNKDAGKIKRDLAKTEASLEKLTAAIEASGHSDTLLARLKTLEASKRSLKAELDADLPPALNNLANLLEDALARYWRVAYSLEDFSRSDVTKARNLIRDLVGGSIVLEATTDGGLQARLQGDYGGLIKLVQEASSKGKSRMVSGARKQRESLILPIRL